MLAHDETLSIRSPALPANCAFVVQFRAHARGETAPAAGRVEHIVSGQTMQFDSWEQLRGAQGAGAQPEGGGDTKARKQGKLLRTPPGR